jgi:peptidoglycan glycosyltransferase
VLIAESKPQGGGSHPIYVRDYPQTTLFGNPVGYSFVNVTQSGIERSENDLLSGSKNEFATIIDQLSNQEPVGADITLTLDAQAQQVATSALQSAINNTPGASGYGGSVVAIEPSTGAVRVMASVPGFDPNKMPDADYRRTVSEEGSGSPLVNRPTQSTYEPGSTMKVVTAAAALDSGEFTPDTVLSGHSPQEIGGVDLSNAGGEQFGDIDMDTALTHSVNTYFAQVGEKLGTATMFEYMDRFGFNKDPELDFPDIQMAPSGVYSGGHLLDESDAIDIGRVAIGQERLLTTPMQMAEVAAAVANDGTLMKPTFLQEAKDPDGRTIEELDPDEQSEVISSDTANELTDMMTHVTEEGTAAGLTVQGASFAGKTGTAEIDIENSINRPWFIGFAPADDPQIAIAVMLERCEGCFGGTVAGPIATQVMEDLLN